MTTDKKLSNPFLLQADDLSIEDINLIFEVANYFLNNYKPGIKFNDLKGVTVALAFFENSTRTKLSFELAAKRLSADVFSFQSKTSSLAKGESLIDTLRTIEAMGVEIYVVRHSCSGVPHFLQRNSSGIVINAGDGKHEHPTQALLDAFTLKQHFGSLQSLNVCIIGDILHSRVARSNIKMLSTLGANLGLCAPGTLLPRDLVKWNCKIFDDIQLAIDWANVLLVLRLQRERMESGLLPSMSEFSKYFGIKYSHLTSKPELVLLHPGPVNYGIELDYRLSSYPNVLIQTQVTHGVFIRMSLLYLFKHSFLS